uniref:NADH-ubiquinone oxidoreductase chain 2 n=1 Tax=Parasagitta elegans TaxID=1562708 RepID=A0A141CKV4_9BILA|nr:NADH dehydrogenase subunit 2 [Parasagitta elegans]
MLYGVFLGTIVVSTSYSWPVAWIGLELNLMTFIPVAMAYSVHKKAAMTYFVSQSCGSLMILLGGMMSDFSVLPLVLLLVGVVFKMGLMPLHFWVPSVAVNLSRFNLYLLMSWQKIGPMVIIMTATLGLAMLSIINAVGGALAMSGITLLPLLLIFSGMVQISWVLNTNGFFTFYYISVYFIVLSAVILYSALASTQFGWALLNAGGLPPFSGFMIKLKAILHIKSGVVVLLVGSSGIALTTYMRILLNTRMKTDPWSWFVVSTMAVGSV